MNGAGDWFMRCTCIGALTGHLSQSGGGGSGMSDPSFAPIAFQPTRRYSLRHTSFALFDEIGQNAIVAVQRPVFSEG